MPRPPPLPLLLLLLLLAPARAHLTTYFVYPHDAFLVNRECHTRYPKNSGNDGKHSVDLLFLRDVLGHTPGAPAEQRDPVALSAPGGRPAGVRVSAPDSAEVFVVPVACSQCLARGGNVPAKTLPLWKDLFAQLVHMKPFRRDHLIICDYFSIYGELDMLKRHRGQGIAWPRQLMLGVFEGGGPDSERLATGYSTFNAVWDVAHGVRRQGAPATFVPASARRYKAMFVGDYGKGGYCGGQKRELLNKQLKAGATVPPDFFFAKRLPWANTSAAMRDALVVLALGGDTLTSDRIFNAFDSNTIIAALDCDRGSLLNFLPFHFKVPWRTLILWIPTDGWVKDPIAAIRAAVDGMGPEEAQRRLNLMERLRPDVTWTRTDSRASANLLEEAYRRSKYFY